MVSQELFFHGFGALVHTAAIVQIWMAYNKVQLLQHPLPYMPDLALKEEQAGIHAYEGSRLKKTWEGVARNIATEEFAVTFRLWLDRHTTNAFGLTEDTQEIIRNNTTTNYSCCLFIYGFHLIL
jgi:hypothetical protein